MVQARRANEACDVRTCQRRTTTACARTLGCRRSQRERRRETHATAMLCDGRELQKTSQLTGAYFTSRPITLRPSADGTAKPLLILTNNILSRFAACRELQGQDMLLNTCSAYILLMRASARDVPSPARRDTRLPPSTTTAAGLQARNTGSACRCRRKAPTVDVDLGVDRHHRHCLSRRQTVAIVELESASLQRPNARTTSPLLGMHSTTFHSSCIIDMVEARGVLAVTLAPRAITKVGVW